MQQWEGRQTDPPHATGPTGPRRSQPTQGATGPGAAAASSRWDADSAGPWLWLAS